MKKNIVFLSLLAVVLLVVSLGAMCLGSVKIDVAEVYRSIFTVNASVDNYIIVTKIRIPRVLIAILVGGMLGVAGAMLQGLLKNPLVDPFITGISSGAAFGAAIGIVAGLNNIMAPAAVGAVVTIFVVYRISLIYGRMNITNLLLAGVMVGSLFSSLIMLVYSVFNRDLIKVVFWLMGDLSNTSTATIVAGSIIAVIVLVLAIYYANDLNILTTGEEEAQTMGVNTEKIKTIYFISAGLLTGLAVALSGVIGFVGLIIPHIIRHFTGPDMRIMIPGSFLGGGIFLLVADTVSRTLFLPGEIPVGIITGLIGAPVFLYILMRRNA